MRKINLIVVHCSATKPSMKVNAARIRKWHTDMRPQGRGWSDIGYHYVINTNGTLEAGRPLRRGGAHVRGHNENSIGICLIGGLDEKGKSTNTYSTAQMITLRTMIGALQQAFPAITDVCGHRDLSPDKDGDGKVEKHEWLKDCPCFNVREWYS